MLCSGESDAVQRRKTHNFGHSATIKSLIACQGCSWKQFDVVVDRTKDLFDLRLGASNELKRLSKHILNILSYTKCLSNIRSPCSQFSVKPSLGARWQRRVGIG
jgi:hypothetical protein